MIKSNFKTDFLKWPLFSGQPNNLFIYLPEFFNCGWYLQLRERICFSTDGGLLPERTFGINTIHS